MLSQWGRGSSLAPTESRPARVAGMGRAAISSARAGACLDGLFLFSYSVDAFARQESAARGKAFTLHSPSQQKHRRQPSIVNFANTLATQYLFCAGGTVIALARSFCSRNPERPDFGSCAGPHRAAASSSSSSLLSQLRRRRRRGRRRRTGAYLSDDDFGDKRHGRRGSPTNHPPRRAPVLTVVEEEVGRRRKPLQAQRQPQESDVRPSAHPAHRLRPRGQGGARDIRWRLAPKA
jgi:hypothetical protein